MRVQRASSSPPRARKARRALERGAARLAGLLAVALSLVPTWALACPTCAARPPEAAGRSALLVGGMLLVPFLLVALGVWAAWRAARGDAKRGR